MIRVGSTHPAKGVSGIWWEKINLFNKKNCFIFVGVKSDYPFLGKSLKSD